MKTGIAIGIGVAAAAVVGGAAWWYESKHPVNTASASSASQENAASSQVTDAAGPSGQTVPVQKLGNKMSNASGNNVSLVVPTPAGVGSGITLSAMPSGFTSPVYQFWVQQPSGTWQSSGSYANSDTYTFSPSVSGTYHVVVFAREAGAPSNENAAERSQYEANSSVYAVTIG